MSGLVTRESFPDIVDSIFNLEIVRTREEWREKIFELQDCLMQFDEKLEIPPTHRFCNGIYARELFLPKGSVIVGKIHREEHLNIISCGDVIVATEDGLERFIAPHTFISKVGTKRVVFAREDSIWTTLHPTTETDVSIIESQIICESYNDLELVQISATP